MEDRYFVDIVSFINIYKKFQFHIKATNTPAYRISSFDQQMLSIGTQW